MIPSPPFLAFRGFLEATATNRFVLSLKLVSPQVRSTSCRLSWEAPEDDGGTSISHYQVNMMDLTVNEWVTAAETSDKKVEVQGLKPGHLYR